jgi:xanthine dehydrogenase molybdopterin-binding subunit B
MAEADLRPAGLVHSSLPHDSAIGHVSGRATYIDDTPEPPGLLHLAFGLAPDGHARLKGMDLAAVHAAPGVVAVFTAADIPGENNVGPVAHDEPLLAQDEILYPGQALFLVAATSTEAARRAARKAVFDLEPLPALVSIADADAAQSLIEATQRMARGDAAAGLAAAPHRLCGTLEIGGQEHFYLEGQVAMATPGEAGQVHVLSSTQHPSEGAASHRQPARAQSCRRDGRGAPHGRRVRRQGDAGGLVGGGLRAGRGEDRTVRQDAARPRRRHGDDRQAPRFRRGLRCRLRR